MSDSKFVYTLVGLLAAVLMVCNLKQDVKENFWNTSAPRTVKVFSEAVVGNNVGNALASVNSMSNSSSFNPCGSGTQVQSLRQNQIEQCPGKGRFISVPSFQSDLSPRFANVGVSANILYNPASYENQATPCHPLGYNASEAQKDFSCMAKENYKPGKAKGKKSKKNVKENYGFGCSGCGGCGSCSAAKCGKGGLPDLGMVVTDPKVGPGYHNGDWNEVAKGVYGGAGSGGVASALAPVGTMSSLNADGRVANAVIYDRFMFANQKSRLEGLGDRIRGDLAIVPNHGNWFNVAVNPEIDLTQGAMAVMGGQNNSTSRELSQLILNSNRGAVTTIGGVNTANQFSSGFLEQGRMQSVTAFP